MYIKLLENNSKKVFWKYVHKWEMAGGNLNLNFHLVFMS